LILIVGGGIGGLSLAACLARAGIDCEVVERNDVWTTVGGGITLYPNGMRALEAVGARPEVEAAGLPLERIRLLARDGRELAEAPGEVWAGVGRTVVVDRRALQRALRTAAAGVPVRLGTSVAGIDTDAVGARVTFSDGTTGDYERVVGADGIRSTVRRLVFGAPRIGYVGQMYWRTAVSAELVEVATMMFDRDRYVVVFPLGGGVSYVAFQLRSPEPLTNGSMGHLRSRFADFAAPAPSALDAVDGDPTLHFGPAEEVVDHLWHGSSVVLIGDAAHACSPTMAQGGSLAIEDAVVLSEELDRHGTAEAAVEAFAARRAPRAAWVRDRTHVEIESLNKGVGHLGERSQETKAMLAAPI
jgi:2-polyprenyl-6-methoxyphenol hydroxylase-like FAD-dependent oxidoreductase